MALLKPRNSRSGGDGLVDKDLQDMAQGNLKPKEVDCELEYELLSRHVDNNINFEGTIIGYNIEENKQNNELLATTEDL